LLAEVEPSCAIPRWLLPNSIFVFMYSYTNLDLAPRIKKLLADITTVEQYVQDLRSLLNESPLAERKSFIRSFVKEVRVTGNKVLLNYTIPLPPKGLMTEETTVLSTIHYGGAHCIMGTDKLSSNTTIPISANKFFLLDICTSFLNYFVFPLS